MAAPGAMEITDVAAAIRWQHEHTTRAFAPCTARVVLAELAIMQTDTAIGQRIAAWQRPSLEDALPLRVAGGLHHLFLTGDAPELGPVYSGELTDQAAIDAIAVSLVQRFDARLSPWLDGPPQTNEAGRSASIMGALLWLAGHVVPRFDLNEIGASAGVNTMMDRYRYDLGGVRAGPEHSPMQITPEWKGPPPPATTIGIHSIRGSDIAPVDLADPVQALRLKAYVWADARERMARIDAAIALAGQQRPDLVQADAGEWVPQMLARPHESGTTRVLYHSIMWQYLPAATRAAITAAMEAAGALATADQPLAWIRLETNRQTFRHELAVRYWPRGGEWMQLAEAHPHGAWVEWYDQPRVLAKGS
ncbi:MAG: hypothetical protein RLZZ08_1825 [Pseudomonadota bacterium]|jgi:hypothetical protein